MFAIKKAQEALPICTIFITDLDHDYIIDGIIHQYQIEFEIQIYIDDES